MSNAGESSEDLKELGNKAFAAKEFEEAIKHYSAAIKLDPHNHVFFSNRSASHGGLKNWKEASDDAKECIRLDPSFIKGYYRLATAQIELKDYDGAMATARQGLNMEADNPQLLKLMRTIKQLKKAATTKAATSKAPGPHQTTALDEATARELQDLQIQFAQTNREFNMVKANLNKAEREHKLAELTKSQLAEVPKESKCYRSIGKMFMLSTRDRVLEHLDKQMEEGIKKESEMTQKLEYLERRMKSQRQNMDELVSSSSAAE